MQALLAASCARSGAVQGLRKAFATCFATEAANTRTVCFLDPKYLLDAGARSEAMVGQQGSERVAVAAKLPQALLDQLSQAKFQKSDSDAPESHWIVGQPAEMFNYKLLGMHKVASSFTCIVDAPDAKPGQAAKYFPPLPDSLRDMTWEKVRSMADEAHGEGPEGQDTQEKWWPEGFIWVGRLVDSASASVYMKQDGTGLWIHSNYDPLDW